MLAIVLTSCDSLSQRLSQGSTATPPPPLPTPTIDNALSATSGSLFEVNTPAPISRLAANLSKYQPQVKILSPKFDEILSDDTVTVKLSVDNLPLFKSALGLGNHLHVILDKQPYQGVYDLNQPLVLKNLSPGTHSLRVFAARPWHESFKNEGAYDRVTFHVLTTTAENNPDPQKPLLTYSRPSGTYGAEPIMLDYYLTNAPSHPASDNSQEQIPDWRIRVTINDQRFILDRWAPVYLQGFKRGKNLVKMELVDDLGNPIPNVYNENISSFTYDPQQQDPLAPLVTGSLDPTLALALVDPSHIANKSVPTSAVPNVTTPPTTTIPSTLPAPTQSAHNTIVPAPQPQVSLATPAPITPVPALPTSSPTQQPLVNPAPRTIAVIPVPTAEVTPNLAPDLAQERPLAQPAPSEIAPVERPTAVPITPVPSLSTPPPSVAPAQQPIAVAPQLPIATAPIIQPSAAPLAQPVPSVIVPVQPLPTPSASVAPVPPTPALQPSIPTTTTVLTLPAPQPSTAPTPPVAIAPTTPAPAAPIIPVRPLPTPQESIAPISPTPTLQPSTPAITSVPPSPTPLAPQVAKQDTPTWQTKAIELFDVGRAKIRQFTNTIPSKAQRFARNLKTWTGYAIDKIQEFRSSQD